LLSSWDELTHIAVNAVISTNRKPAASNTPMHGALAASATSINRCGWTIHPT
jgi:hypothetical protein